MGARERNGDREWRPHRELGLPTNGLRVGRDRPEVRSRKQIPTRAKSPPVHARISSRISLKGKAPTRVRATNVQVSKLSFENHPPRVRKRARVKHVAPAREDGGQGGERGEIDEGSRCIRKRGCAEWGEGRWRGQTTPKGNYPKTRYLDWTPWGARW